MVGWPDARARLAVDESDLRLLSCKHCCCLVSALQRRLAVFGFAASRSLCQVIDDTLEVLKWHAHRQRRQVSRSSNALNAIACSRVRLRLVPIDGKHTESSGRPAGEV